MATTKDGSVRAGRTPCCHCGSPSTHVDRGLPSCDACRTSSSTGEKKASASPDSPGLMYAEQMLAKEMTPSSDRSEG